MPEPHADAKLRIWTTPWASAGRAIDQKQRIPKTRR